MKADVLSIMLPRVLWLKKLFVLNDGRKYDDNDAERRKRFSGKSINTKMNTDKKRNKERSQKCERTNSKRNQNVIKELSKKIKDQSTCIERVRCIL